MHVAKEITKIVDTLYTIKTRDHIVNRDGVYNQESGTTLRADGVYNIKSGIT